MAALRARHEIVRRPVRQAEPARFGMGFGLAGAMPLPNPNTIFWGGYGGSLVIIDMDARTTFAYAMNKMAPTTTGDMRAFGLAMAMWEAMGAI